MPTRPLWVVRTPLPSPPRVPASGHVRVVTGRTGLLHLCSKCRPEREEPRSQQRERVFLFAGSLACSLMYVPKGNVHDHECKWQSRKENLFPEGVTIRGLEKLDVVDNWNVGRRRNLLPEHGHNIGALLHFTIL